MTHPARVHVAHRPWPLPDRPWALTMQWHDLAFLHWRVAAAPLQARLPAGLELDTFDGSAWVGVVPFRMVHTRVRCLPPVPGTWTYPEVNVRTYVRGASTAGVWFFSLDVASRLTVAAARAGFGLPYFAARSVCTRRGAEVTFRSERRSRHEPAAFAATWAASAVPAAPAAGTLEHFVSERYCLFASRRGRLVRGDIAHAPWQLAPATVRIDRCELTRALGVELDRAPDSALAAAPQHVLAWAPRRVHDAAPRP